MHAPAVARPAPAPRHAARRPPGRPLPPARSCPSSPRSPRQSGITWTRSFGDHDLSNIVEGTGSGACVFDYDGDGKLDVYFPQGRWEKTVSDNRGRDLIDKLRNALYRGKGGFQFEDVTEKAGVAGRGFAFGCSAADYDNDGDLDLLVLTYKGPELYRNNGDGTFTEVAEKAGLADTRWSLNARLARLRPRRRPRPLRCNYLEYDEGKFRSFYAAAGYPGPLSYNGVPCALYRNNGDGTFTDVTKEAGVSNPGGRAMSAVAADLNNDGWIDVYVANDSMENYYYENQARRDVRGEGARARRSPSARTARASPRWAPRWPTSTATATSTSSSPTWTTGACSRSRAGSTSTSSTARASPSSAASTRAGAPCSSTTTTTATPTSSSPTATRTTSTRRTRSSPATTARALRGRGARVGRLLPDEVGRAAARPGPTSTTTATWTCWSSTPPARRTCCATTAARGTTG